MKKLAAVLVTAVSLLGLAGVGSVTAAPAHETANPCCKTVE